MENATYILFIIFIIIVSLVPVYFYIKGTKNESNKISQLSQPSLSGIEKDEEKLINFSGSIANSIEQFNNILAQKFEYYLLNDIMSYFIAEKEIPIQELKELKEKYYVDICLSLNPNFLNNLGEVYTKHGLQLIINQTFIKLLNKAQLSNRPKNINKRTLDAIIGE